MKNRLPLISVVVPVYNVKKYLEECLDSLVHQDFENYEIVLVDDGSTDGSGEICEKYSNSYSYIKSFHQENVGLSIARNNGVNISCGEYITFVDSDDYVSSLYLHILWETMNEYSADIVCTSLISFGDREKYTRSKCGLLENKLLTSKESLQAICYGRILDVTACGKLFKKSHLKIFPFPEGKLYEDLAVTYKVIIECEKILVITNKIYFYRQRMNSIRHSRVTDLHLEGLDLVNKMCEEISNIYPDLVQDCTRRRVSKAIGYLPMLTVYKDYDKLNIIRSIVKQNLSGILKNKKISLFYKIACICIAQSTLLALIIGKILLKGN